MQFISILGFSCFAICLTWASGNSTVYQKACSNSSECAVYPSIDQGPEVIWIPFFCNEKNLCACPNGWIPLVSNDICISQVSGSTWSTSTGSIWGMSLLFAIVFIPMTYGCTSLFSRCSRLVQSMGNDQHSPSVNLGATV